MFFKNIQDKFDYTWIRELWQFSDLEIRLKNINEGTSKEVLEILDNESIKNYKLVWNYLNINFNDDYLKELFLWLDIEKERENKSIIIHFFSPNPWQNIHLGVLRNILLWLFISNVYKNQYTNVKTETMLCDSWEVFETLLSIYDWKEALYLDKDFYDNPLLEYENKAKNIVKDKEFDIKKWSSIESREKVTDFSLGFFKNQLSILWLFFDEVNLQSNFSYVDEELLSVFEKEFKIYKDWDWVWLFIIWQKNPQMVINQNWTPTYLLRELNWIVKKYIEGNNDFLFIVWIDQKHHFKIVKEILTVIYPEINVNTHFHSMVVLKDWKDKKSAKNYTLEKLNWLVELNIEFLNYFSQENILLLYLMSDMFIAKKDKEVVFNWVFENKEIAERIIKNYIYLNIFDSFQKYDNIIWVKSWLDLYKWITNAIVKKETSFIINSLSLDYSYINFQSEDELKKFIKIFKYWLEIIWIKPII